MSVTGEPSSPPPLLFDKFVVNKRYGVSRVKPSGEVEPLASQEALEKLDSDFFSGSIAFTRDTNHVGLLHKLIFAVQKTRAFFSRSKHIDASLCHAVIILGRSQKPEQTLHPFVVAQAGSRGITVTHRDCLAENDVTDFVIYRSVDETIRQLYKDYAETTAFVEREEERTDLSPPRKASFSYWDMVTSFFHGKRHAIRHTSKPDQTITRRVSYLIADFFLQNQIEDRSSQPKALFCSAYAAYVLQGTLLIHSLRDLTMKEIVSYISPSCSRDALAKKIHKSLVKDDPNDPVAHTLWHAFRQMKLMNYNSRFAMSGYIARLLDKLSLETTPAEGP